LGIQLDMDFQSDDSFKFQFGAIMLPQRA
jgi:hypothetical protein